jgi:SAM-dependent methyltransferase
VLVADSPSSQEALPGLPGSGDLASAQGYSRRLLSGGSLATRLSHRGRIATSLHVLDGRSFDRAADVGAADGWYLRGLIERGVVKSGVAIDADSAMLAAGEEVSKDAALTFCLPGSAELAAQRGTFDLVACLETLEHVDDAAEVLAVVVGLAKPGGTVLISVPVEVGPSVLVKQLGRWRANRKGTYGYQRYTWRELVVAAFLWRIGGLTRQNLHSHKGFDYRKMRTALGALATIEETVYSPSPRLGPVLASTVFWVATKRQSQSQGGGIDDGDQS